MYKHVTPNDPTTETPGDEISVVNGKVCAGVTGQGRSSFV